MYSHPLGSETSPDVAATLMQPQAKGIKNTLNKAQPLSSMLNSMHELVAQTTTSALPAAVGALSIWMQKISSPFSSVAFATVVVVKRSSGVVSFKYISTFTGTVPGWRGKDIPCMVRLPNPMGKGHDFVCEASPLQCNITPITAFDIVRSNLALATVSSSLPWPTNVVFAPRATAEGPKSTIGAWTPLAPQSECFKLIPRADDETGGDSIFNASMTLSAISASALSSSWIPKWACTHKISVPF